MITFHSWVALSSFIKKPMICHWDFAPLSQFFVAWSSLVVIYFWFLVMWQHCRFVISWLVINIIRRVLNRYHVRFYWRATDFSKMTMDFCPEKQSCLQGAMLSIYQCMTPFLRNKPNLTCSEELPWWIGSVLHVDPLLTWPISERIAWKTT